MNAPIYHENYLPRLFGWKFDFAKSAENMFFSASVYLPDSVTPSSQRRRNLVLVDPWLQRIFPIGLAASTNIYFLLVKGRMNISTAFVIYTTLRQQTSSEVNVSTITPQNVLPNITVRAIIKVLQSGSSVLCQWWSLQDQVVTKMEATRLIHGAIHGN